MIAVILKFEPIPGYEDAFIAAWKECTQVIYETFGSLGSRLHRSDEGDFIAYAQWPNTETYEKSAD